MEFNMRWIGSMFQFLHSNFRTGKHRRKGRLAKRDNSFRYSEISAVAFMLDILYLSANLFILARYFLVGKES